MATVESVKQGWFYECLTELQRQTLRLRPSRPVSATGTLPRRREAGMKLFYRTRTINSGLLSG